MSNLKKKEERKNIIFLHSLLADRLIFRLSSSSVSYRTAENSRKGCSKTRLIVKRMIEKHIPLLIRLFLLSSFLFFWIKNCINMRGCDFRFSRFFFMYNLLYFVSEQKQQTPTSSCGCSHNPFFFSQVTFSSLISFLQVFFRFSSGSNISNSPQRRQFSRF